MPCRSDISDQEWQRDAQSIWTAEMHGVWIEAGNVARWRDLEAAEVEETLEATLAAGGEVAGMGLEL